MLHNIALARASAICDLFAVEPGSVEHLASKPRNATEREVRAYFDWLRRRADLPDLGAMALQASGTFGDVGGRYNAACQGATFGKQLKPAKWEGQVHTPAQFEDGAYSIPMPGYQRQPARVTLETLDEAGEVVASSTLPVEPKKGGVIWTAADVRKAHGPIAKPARAKRATPAPIEGIGVPAGCAPEPVEAACEPIAAATPAPELEIALYGPEIAPEAQSEPEADPLPAILARLEALEAAIATLPVETEATPTVAKRERSPAHERAVRRAWAERRERRTAAVHLRIGQAQYDAVVAERDALRAELQRARSAVEAADRSAQQHWREAEAVMGRRIAATGRARRLLAASRRAETVQRQRADVLAAQLAKVRADMADPSQPERASDIAQLVRERDETRTANAALQDRCRRAEAARDELAGAVESMGTRLANAEAAVRRLAA